MRRSAIVVSAMFSLAALGTVSAQPARPAANAAQAMDFSKVQERSTDLGHGLYMISGAGGNTTLAVGGDGLIVVDSQFAPVYPKLKSKITEISTAPVKYLVDTHYHFDHTGGNAAFAGDGAVIVAQQTVVKRLQNPSPGPNGVTIPASPPKAIPTLTYDKRLTLSVKGQTAQLIHVPAAHTDGDTLVYFPGANVLSTGDIVTSGGYPFIDLAAGGSIDGMIRAVDRILSLTNDATRIVPGHGELTNKAGMRKYWQMLVTARHLVAEEIAAGKSEDQTVADHPLAELNKKWGAHGGPIVDLFPRLVYGSLKKS